MRFLFLISQVQININTQVVTSQCQIFLTQRICLPGVCPYRGTLDTETTVRTGGMMREDEGRDELTALRQPRNAVDCLQTPASQRLVGEARNSITALSSQPCQHPDLGLVASRTKKNKLLLFMPVRLWSFIVAVLLVNIIITFPLTWKSTCYTPHRGIQIL